MLGYEWIEKNRKTKHFRHQGDKETAELWKGDEKPKHLFEQREWRETERMERKQSAPSRNEMERTSPQSGERGTEIHRFYFPLTWVTQVWRRIQIFEVVLFLFLWALMEFWNESKLLNALLHGGKIPMWDLWVPSNEAAQTPIYFCIVVQPTSAHFMWFSFQ